MFAFLRPHASPEYLVRKLLKRGLGYLANGILGYSIRGWILDWNMILWNSILIAAKTHQSQVSYSSFSISCFALVIWSTGKTSSPQNLGYKSPKTYSSRTVTICVSCLISLVWLPLPSLRMIHTLVFGLWLGFWEKFMHLAHRTSDAAVNFALQ